jgi:hypothetical protein
VPASELFGGGATPIGGVVGLMVRPGLTRSNPWLLPTGAVGTPIWYGFGGLGLGEDNLQKARLSWQRGHAVLAEQLTLVHVRVPAHHAQHFATHGMGPAPLPTHTSPPRMQIGLKAAIIVGLCAYVVAPMAALFLVPMR